MFRLFLCNVTSTVMSYMRALDCIPGRRLYGIRTTCGTFQRVSGSLQLLKKGRVKCFPVWSQEFEMVGDVNGTLQIITPCVILTWSYQGVVFGDGGGNWAGGWSSITAVSLWELCIGKHPLNSYAKPCPVYSTSLRFEKYLMQLAHCFNPITEKLLNDVEK